MHPPPVPPPTLFDPSPLLPRWEMLPLAERQAALRLLAQLLRDHPPLPHALPPEEGRASAARARKAVADE